MLISHHLYNFSFLLRTHSTGQYHIRSIDQADKLRRYLIISKHFLQGITTDDHAHLAFDHLQILSILSDADLLIDFGTATAVNYVLVDIIIKQTACIANVNRCLNFITREDP